jgi:hypothetical protein
MDGADVELDESVGVQRDVAGVPPTVAPLTRAVTGRRSGPTWVLLSG